MRYLLIVLTMLLCPVSAGYADVSVGFGIPGLNIGINVPAYPDLVQVPGYPVYYDPRSDSHGTTLSHCAARLEDLCACEVARNGEQLMVLGSSLNGMRFDSSGADR